MSESKRATVAEASPSPDPEKSTTQEETTVTAAPPLPDEPEPESTAPPLPEEPEPEPEAREQETIGQDDEVWDPAAETDLKGRKAVEEKKAGDQNDTGGWQAVWAPTANGKSHSCFQKLCMRAGS
jgi:hypothetical protein